MMSQVHCKQSIRIEKSGWFKHYFPGNLRRNILLKVCNYTSYQNLQKTALFFADYRPPKKVFALFLITISRR